MGKLKFEHRKEFTTKDESGCILTMKALITFDYPNYHE